MNARDEAVEMIRRICPPHLSADEYGQILTEKFDAHRAEVLNEGADEIVAANDRLLWATQPGMHWAADLLREMATAHTQPEEATAPAATATPQPPVCPVCQNPGCCCRCFGKTPRTDCPHAAAAPFFQPGHTYSAHLHADIRFECLALSADPDTGEQQAIGWRFSPPHDGIRRHRLAALDASDWACCGWTDTTDSGEDQ